MYNIGYRNADVKLIVRWRIKSRPKTAEAVPKGTASLLLPRLVDELSEVSAMSAEQSRSDVPETVFLNGIRAGDLNALVETTTKNRFRRQVLPEGMMRNWDTFVPEMFRY